MIYYTRFDLRVRLRRGVTYIVHSLIHLLEEQGHLSISEIGMADRIEHIAEPIAEHDPHNMPGTKLRSLFSIWQKLYGGCPLRMVLCIIGELIHGRGAQRKESCTLDPLRLIVRR